MEGSKLASFDSRWRIEGLGTEMEKFAGTVSLRKKLMF
jgi:hypothetical protein